MSLPGAGIPGGRPRSAWRKALIYLGLADDDPVDPYFPAHLDRPRRGAPAGALLSRPDDDALARIERKLDEQAAQIAELRAEVRRLGRS